MDLFTSDLTQEIMYIDPDKKFRISETGWNGEEGEEQILSGRTLHNAGLTMPLPTEEGQAFIFKVESL